MIDRVAELLLTNPEVASSRATPDSLGIEKVGEDTYGKVLLVTSNRTGECITIRRDYELNPYNIVLYNGKCTSIYFSSDFPR